MPLKGQTYPLAGRKSVWTRLTINIFAQANSTFSLLRFLEIPLYLTLRNPNVSLMILNACSTLLCNVMNIRRCCRNWMYKSRARVYTDIAFHAKFPLVAFLSLVHFWITFFLCIFGGTWRIYYCCVNYCSAEISKITTLLKFTEHCERILMKKLPFQGKW